MKTKALPILICLILFLSISGCIEENNNSENHTNEDNPIAFINTTMGVIKVELYQQKVPHTVENFIRYAKDGFYDGLVFHRVVAGLMIQSGGYYPNGTYKEPTYDPIALEIHEDIRHIDGAIGIGPSINDINLTCQFYICVGPQHQLDDKYPIFGVVIDGMEVVRSISGVQIERKYDLNNWPVNDILINSVEIIE